MLDQLELEESLYEAIIDIYRRPDKMFKLTKEYKHPWADDFVYAAVTRLTRFASTVLARRASVPENRATFKDGADEIDTLIKNFQINCKTCCERMFRHDSVQDRARKTQEVCQLLQTAHAGNLMPPGNHYFLKDNKCHKPGHEMFPPPPTGRRGTSLVAVPTPEAMPPRPDTTKMD